MFLYLQNNQITDISSLVGLTKLKWMKLNSNQISDISTLARLTNFELLDLRDNPLNPETYSKDLQLIEANNPDIQIIDFSISWAL